MRMYWLQTLLLAAVISLPPDGIAAPCIEKKYFKQGLVIREAEAAVIPIIPIPKPVVPAIKPWPAVSKPIVPKPITPKPLAPKPLEPAQPISGPGLQCKRAPGDPCSNIAPFQNADLETIRTKGRDAQASLLATQKADSKAQDVDRVTVSTNYDHTEVPEMTPPLQSDEVEFLSQGSVQVPYTQEPVWIEFSTRNQPGVNTKMDNNILVTSTSTKDRGMVIVDSRNKENDLAAAKDKALWSDMVMFDLKKAFNSDKIKPDELRYMVRSSIQGGSSAERTQGYIEAAITRTGSDRAKSNTFRSDPEAPGILPDEIAAYQLLAGSDHVHRVLLMLKDYPTTMKNVRVESLSVTTPDTEGADDLYNIVIKFTKVDNP